LGLGTHAALVALCEPVISRLLDAGVRFLIVGGWAVQFHGYKERRVKDLDLLVDFSGDNWPRLIMALGHLKVSSVPGFDELSQRIRPFRIYYDPVDLLTAIGSAFAEPPFSPMPNSGRRLAVASSRRGVSFDEAWADSVETDFGDKRLRVLSKAHLILSKEHSKHSTDADDARKLLDVG
jgi:hypothetical protein